MEKLRVNEMTFEQFYQELHPRIVRYLAGRCATIQDAEDLANESFLYCMNHWEDFDPAKATRQTWLYIIVRSRWKNYLRDHKTFSSLDGLDEIIPGEDILDQTVWLQSLRDELAELLMKLPEQQREAIILRYFQQWDDEQIARWLGISRVNVRVSIHRGIKRMNKELPTELRTVLTE